MTTPTTAVDIPTLYRVPLTLNPFQRIRNWNDMNIVHKAVMTMFPPVLPGNAGERRATSSILYRIEPDPTPHLLLQTLTPVLPEYQHDIEIATLAPILAHLEHGMPVYFRTRINAVRKRGNKRIPITADELPTTLINPEKDTGLLHGALTNIAIVDTHHSTLHNRETPINTFRITGTATVDDPAALTNKIIHGIGPARSYGCGLLSVLP